MNKITSYTPTEVAEILKISRFTVYEMIKRGDLLAYRIGRKMRIEADDLEKYHKKSHQIFPDHPIAVQESNFTSFNQEGLILCGQDIILDILTRHLRRKLPNINFLRNYVGSIEGLLSLYKGTANAVTAHLWDRDTNTYNTPYVRRLLPGHSTMIINLAYRIEGFYVAKGNPKLITAWQDLIRPDVQLVNRECGAGARVLLDESLRLHNLDYEAIIGYEHEELSHLAVASCVARSEADVGVGIEKVAMQVQNIDFISLQKERYDLVIRKEDAKKLQFAVLLAIIKSKEFRKEIAGIGGYDVTNTGETMAET
jgi:putative molybdopterin biosynthesis protein